MKKLLCATGLGLALTVATGVQAADKIAVVKMAEVFQQMPQSSAVAKQLESEFKGRASELQSQERSLQEKMRHLQRDGATMKASERSKLEKDILTQRDAFNAKAQAFDQDNRRRQAEERNKLVKSIQDKVKKVASAEGYDIVLDANAVVYAADAKDITAEVLKAK